MKLTAEEVEYIAALARLELSAEEKVSFRRQLSTVLEFVDKLAEADTAGVKPMDHVMEMHNVFRVDAIEDCDPSTRRGIIDGFPEKEADLLKVKAVFS